MDSVNRVATGRIGIKGLPVSYDSNDSDSFVKCNEIHQPRILGTKATEFMRSLPYSIRKQVSLLLDLQTQKRRLEENYQKELLALEQKYSSKYKPLYKERANVVSGANVQGDLDIDMENFLGPVAGVPEFWFRAMENHPSISDLIQTDDEEALSYLTDIRVEYIKPPSLGFRLLFVFAENDFFTNRTLSKTYTYETSDDGAELFYGEVRGDIIAWKAGMKLTHQTRLSRDTRNQPLRESFFDFFNPPKYPPYNPRDIEIVEMKLALDYGYGELFKDKLIPDAVDWFIGEAADWGESEEQYQPECANQ